MQAIVKTSSSVAVTSRRILSDYATNNDIRRRALAILPSPVFSARILANLQYDYQNPNYIAKYSVGYLNQKGYYLPCCQQHRYISLSTTYFDNLKPSSKVEETVQAIKEKNVNTDNAVTTPPAQKLPILTRIWNELVHYYHGFRLLFIDISVSRKLLWRVLNGKSLSRREHKLLVRTVGDVFRLLPFSVFIIVPFMELLLPLAIKFFPGMLPSTFETATERDGKLRQSLKVRLEMAKFLQTTLDEMSVQSKEKDAQSAKEFTDFFRKIRTSGEAATTEEILKFSKLFADEITLDSLSRQQLTALCRVLDINTVGMTSLLRFQIRMKLRSLIADDKMIQREGVDSLTIQELQSACQARAMRAYGVSEEKLRQQLNQWLDLSLNGKVPPSLLLLSRALMLPESSQPSDQLKATISALPDTVELKAAAAINEREGVIDNKTKIQLIKEEEERIKEERAELRAERKRVEEETKELLVDSAPVINVSTELKKRDELSTSDLEALEDALDTLGKEKKTLIVEKEELDELKEELQDYQEDVKELNEVLEQTDTKKQLRETKAAQNLFKKVNSMIEKMDTVLEDLQNKDKTPENISNQKLNSEEEESVRIDELMDVIKRIQKIPDEAKLAQISDILGKMDDDHDGAISVDEVLKVIELIGKENVQITGKQLDEILQLLEKEEVLELEEQIEKALEKQSSEKNNGSGAKFKNDKDGPQQNDLGVTDNDKKALNASAMSVAPKCTKMTIGEPKDGSNGGTKQL